MSRHLRLVSLVLASLGIVGCTGAPPPGTPTSTQPASPAATVAAQGISDVRRIVIAQDAAPQGLNHDHSEERSGVLERPIISRSGADLKPVRTQPGFVVGRYSEFSGQAGALLSWAALFDTAANAERSLELYLEELRSDDGYGLDTSTEAGLGDEGTCAEGDVVIDRGPDSPSLTVHETICLWRTGSLVLTAGGPMEHAAIRSIADAMQRRVDP